MKNNRKSKAIAHSTHPIAGRCVHIDIQTIFTAFDFDITAIGIALGAFMRIYYRL